MRTTLINFLLLLIFTCNAQIPEIQWQQCFGSSENDDKNAVVEIHNGYLFAIHIAADEPGITNYHGSGDIWLINTDSIGSIIWERCIGGSNGDIPRKIEKINNDEFFIYGYTFSTDGDVQSNNYGEGDLWVIKINGEGDLLWEKCYGSPGPDEARDIIHTPDGGFVLLSRVHVSGGDVSQYYGSWDVWMCKCDSMGNIEWEKTLGNQWLDSGVSMNINSEGNIMMIGAAAHYGGIVDCDVDDGYGDVWVVELDLLGELLWQNCYGGSYYDIGIDMIETEEGYIFTAVSGSNDVDVSGHHGPAGLPPDGWEDIWIVKLNNLGEIIWQNSIGGYGIEYASYITETEDGDIVSIGTTMSDDGDVSGNHSAPDNDYWGDVWVVKLTEDGEIMWQRCYGGWGDESVVNKHQVLKNGDLNYVIASTTNFSEGNDDIQCEIHANMDRDAWIFEIKDTTVGISQTPQNETLKVYPNPANNYVVFETENPANVIAEGPRVAEALAVAQARPRQSHTITITNTYGQQITTLQVKDNKTVWDTRSINSGVYFYSLMIAGEFNSGKVIVGK
jgi:hypothetical protein